MRWIKRGQIFDPTKFKLSNDCFEFAQSPQTIVFDDFIRIYFSTRKRDDKGKFLSHISFVDIDKEFKHILQVSKEPVIKLGNLGCFDEHGIFPINPLRVGDKIFAYTCGWSRRVSVSVETSIGLAISHDNGLTFEKLGEGPILSSSLYEPVLVGDGFVQIYDDVFYMWYIYGTGWKKAEGAEPPARIYKIAVAKSSDGINWQKEEGKQIIADKLNEDECQALPTVVKIGERWIMIFCYREATDFRKNVSRGYRLGFAYSNDLKTWTRDDENMGIDVSDEGWDSEMMCYPHLFQCDGKTYLLYNGNEFGKYGFGLAEFEQFLELEMESAIEYQIKTASLEDVYLHLVGCKNNFIPALDKKVDIFEYSKKIFENSVTFEAWFATKLIGLVAVYFNDVQNKKGFITNVSTISNFLGQGIGSNLVKNCIDYAKIYNFHEISLEVNANNESAIKLYKKFNFIEIDSSNENIFMKCILK